MNETVVPANDIETQLLAAQEGRIAGEVFMQERLNPKNHKKNPSP